ncbi:MAG TPA: hypothetical protein DDZ80_09205 [Cyanobacteria bacterium UBA8803]|nr:hypothetical protein [Cyanobacteria bacterium UBA8803]
MIHDAHPAYISFEQFKANEQQLRQNKAKLHSSLGRKGDRLGVKFCNRVTGASAFNLAIV